MEQERDPGKRLDLNMYTEAHKARGVKRLPLYLLDALREFDKNKVLRSALGDEFSNAYMKIKMEDWDNYARYLTDFERTTTLDC